MSWMKSITSAASCMSVTIMMSACGGNPETVAKSVSAVRTTTDAHVVATNTEKVAPGKVTKTNNLIDCLRNDGTGKEAEAKDVISIATVNREWHAADAARRVALVDALAQGVADDVAHPDGGADAKRQALDAFVLANAPAERDSVVAQRLLPHLATMERDVSEPVLFGYLVNRSLSVEARAAAAEVLVDAGWRTGAALKQYLIEQAVPEGEIASLMSDLEQAISKN
jgi:hypothetical protein